MFWAFGKSIRKDQQGVPFLRNLSKKVNEKVQMFLYKLLLLPILTYGVQFIYVFRLTLQKLDKFEKRWLKWITNKFKFNYEELLILVNLLPLYVSAIEEPTFLFEFNGAEVQLVPHSNIAWRRIEKKSTQNCQNRKNATWVLLSNFNVIENEVYFLNPVCLGTQIRFV